MPHSFDTLQTYAGRWVALTADGQVSGTGETGPAALRAGRQSQPKVPLTVRYVPDLSGEPLTLSPLLAQYESVFAQIDQPLYLVGGAVRDAVLGLISNDLDFTLPAKGIKTAFKVGDLMDRPAYVLDKARDGGRVVLVDEDTYLDFVVYRGESLVADLMDRDLTLNAMALPVMAQTTAEIIDPAGGLQDLRAGIVRQVHDRSLLDDPIRALRAIRMATKFNFSLTSDTKDAMTVAYRRLNEPSAERVRDEFLKIMGGQPGRSLAELDQLGGLTELLPEIAQLDGVRQTPPHQYDVLTHTWQVLDALDEVIDFWLIDRPWTDQLHAHLERSVTGGLSGRDVLRLGALFHDVGKAITQTLEENGRIRFLGHDKEGAPLAAERLTQLKFSREVIRHVKEMVAGHMRPLLFANETEVSTKAIHRFFRKYEAAGLDICLLALADHIGTYGAETAKTIPEWGELAAVIEQMLGHYFSQVVADQKPAPLIDGHVLMTELGLRPGPKLGKILRQIEEAQVAGEIKTPAEAIQLAESLLR